MWPRADNRALSGDVAAIAPRAEALGSRQSAVIDIGSNSVRLVIYRLEGRAIWTVFNEKTLAALGRDLTVTGRLSIEGVETAIIALRRFRAALSGWDADQIFVVATAAVREAADGEAFVARVKAETGLSMRILSGPEEARYAALGVIAGQPDAAGVAGDLGGASLELIHLDPAASRDGVTLPLGPFALGAPAPLDVDDVRRLIFQRLDSAALTFRAREFHAVGGAWRNLALLHMEMADYPLRVAHQYEMSRSDAVDVARFVARQSRGSLERIQGLSKKRFDTLPYSALVLDALIERLSIERVIVSAFGVREGLLLETMPDAVRRRDPLIEGCQALTAVKGMGNELAPALEAWLGPAFDSLPRVFGNREPTLTAAACQLSDLGARLHPDHRAELAFEQVLRAPIAGMSHSERAFLANAIFARHSGSPNLPQATTVSRVLTLERRLRARALGSAIRLGYDLAARNPTLLARTALAIDGDRLILTAEAGWSDILLGEQTAKRAQTLAQVLRLKLQLG